MKKQRIIRAYVYKHSLDPVCWKWWCYPFLNVKMGGSTKTPMGSKRAAERTIKRLDCEPKIKIFWPSLVKKET